MKIYFKTIKMHLKSTLEYKKSFILTTFATFLLTFLLTISIFLLFDKFGNIQGWNFYEVAIIFGIIMFAFSSVEMFARGFDHFHNAVREGDFDRLLLKPAGLLSQVASYEFEPSKLGRMIQSLIVLIIAICNIEVEWNLYRIFILIFMQLGAIVLFFSILIIKATVSFWTIDGLEFMNILSDGGKEVAQYPINIYEKWFARFFTFIIPFGLINYYPLLYLLGKSNCIWFGILPIISMLFLVPTLLFWNVGVKHYTSTGS